MKVKTTSRIFQFVVTLALILLVSCTSWSQLESFRHVGYIQTTITNVNDRSVSFANGSTVKTNRIIIAVNSTPVLLVVENYTGNGYFYLRNSKVGFVLDKSGTDVDIDLMGMKRGEINYVHEINNEKRIIKLADNTKWFVVNDEQWQIAKDWLTSPEIIIPESKPQKGEYFINTSTSEAVFVVRVENPKQE